MIEVSVTVLSGADGPLVVAATERGVVAAAWHPSSDLVVADLRRRFGPIDVRDHRDGGPSARQLHAARPILEGLLAGGDAPAGSIPVDLRDRPAFDQRALAAVRDLGWGETASYGEIARRIGAPRAARAVGGALGRNPIALVIPCHRVIAADGTLGGYGGDGWSDRLEALERKRTLLEREGVIAHRRAR